MTDTYKQHEAAFANLSAFIVTNKKGGTYGNNRLQMPAKRRGKAILLPAHYRHSYANGYGYDKRSAAMVDAITKIGKTAPSDADAGKTYSAFARVAGKIDARQWDSCIRDAGFNVLQAV